MIFLFSLSFIVLIENGFQKRVPKIFQVKLEETNVDLYQKKNTQKVVLIGDSHAKALVYNLNEKMKKNNLSLFRFNTRLYLKDFSYTDKRFNNEFIKQNNDIDNFLKKNSNLMIIFHQRWSQQIDHVYYDNKKRDKEFSKSINEKHLETFNIQKLLKEEKKKNIKEGLISQIKDIINQGHKLILVYPVPEMKFVPQKALYRKHLFEKSFFENSIPILSESYEVFKKKNKLIFEILDSVQSPNIHRVYPDKLFCNKQIENRCVTNDNKNLFYYDNNHLSLLGSEFVVDEIMKIIKDLN